MELAECFQQIKQRQFKSLATRLESKILYSNAIHFSKKMPYLAYASSLDAGKNGLLVTVDFGQT